MYFQYRAKREGIEGSGVQFKQDKAVEERRGRGGEMIEGDE